jgi:hypothetical protein
MGSHRHAAGAFRLGAFLHTLRFDNMGLSAIIPKSFEGAVVETIEMNCAAEAVVGQLVRVNVSQPNFAEVSVDNLSKQPVVGRIKDEIQSTRVVVQLRGVTDVDPALPEGRVFLSPNGSFTTEKILSGYHQELGYSFGNGKVHLNPSQIVTKLS